MFGFPSHPWEGMNRYGSCIADSWEGFLCCCLFPQVISERCDVTCSHFLLQGHSDGAPGER